MLEITEKILASIYATPMTYSEISDLPYLKTISDYGISFSIETLLKDGFIKEKVIDRHPFRTEEYRKKYGEVIKVKYRATKKGEKYLLEHEYLD
jgi:DNA-binding HxlR family transcriptional regulator